MCNLCNLKKYECTRKNDENCSKTERLAAVSVFVLLSYLILKLCEIIKRSKMRIFRKFKTLWRSVNFFQTARETTASLRRRTKELTFGCSAPAQPCVAWCMMEFRHFWTPASRRKAYLAQYSSDSQFKNTVVLGTRFCTWFFRKPRRKDVAMTSQNVKRANVRRRERVLCSISAVPWPFWTFLGSG